MNKLITTSTGGQNKRMAEWLVNQLIPGQQLPNIGPVVFLEHVYPVPPHQHAPAASGTYAVPHRGVVTVSYVLSGALRHADSRGHRCTVAAGGLHWMNAGSGILREQRPAPGPQHEGGLFHGLQFWIMLPYAAKQETPAHRALQSPDIPESPLPHHAGVIRALLGSCGEVHAPFRTFFNEFIFHIKLNPKSAFTCPTRRELEYAVFAPDDEIRVNGKSIGNSHLLGFAIDQSNIDLYNPGITVADVFLFGGSPYTEPIVAEGPFVMNTRDEMAAAYRDFFAGNYGELKTGAG
ncbi:hypothetical protein SAMN05421747_12325 [Parapedobacter composti]|uniref:Pirin C-terminal cupin domain-containing protein n=1 Tax=Parapedobacter composti TaxID=623281 RepID=A0A1I1LQ27_9SPHI|nr:pirin family protein [Parapedobacter composti]SFC75337.1 hypothetical protein SAMN05421747_12325 [Parapedobacter composti]